MPDFNLFGQGHSFTQTAYGSIAFNRHDNALDV